MDEHLFFDLFGDCGEGYLTIWTLPDKATRFFGVSEIGAAIAYAQSRAASHDVYFGVGLRRERLAKGRGGAADIAALTAVYADIDVADGGAHKAAALPESEAEALDFLDGLPLVPTAVVSSGHGLHAYWLLKEPFIICTEQDMLEAQGLLRGWNAYINARAAARGWRFDSVGEPARVLRVPGTLNHKTQPPREVRVVKKTDAGYNVEDIRDWCVDTADESPAARHSRNGFAPPPEISDGKRNDTLFRLAASLRAKGLNVEAIEAALLAENAIRCRPPLPDGEVRCIARSAGRYEAGASCALKAEETLEPIAAGGTAEEIMSDATFDALFAVTNELKRQMMYHRLLERARALKKAKAFEGIYRARKALHEQEMKARRDADNRAEGVNLVLPGLPVSGLVTPDQWEIDEDGVRRVRMVKGAPVVEKACSHPVIISERYENVDTKTRKVRLHFYENGRWEHVTAPRSVVFSRQGIVSLSDAGIGAHSENAKFLVQYLGDFEEANRGRLPYKNSIGRLGWVGREHFAPYSADVVFDGESSFRETFQAVKAQGDRGRWIEAAEQARKDLRGRLALAASFASPLVSLTGTNIFVVHLWGESGVGKTVALYLAESVWGDPRILTKTFNGTAVGLERIAAFFHSLPLALDELQTIKDKFSIMQMLYRLTEGKGKARGTKDGGVEADTVWRNVVITNGEQPLTDDAFEGGAKNRAIEVCVNSPMFDGRSREIVEAVTENYGHAGAGYVAGIMNEEPDAVRCVFREFRRALSEKENGLPAEQRHTDKQLDGLAMLAAGDYFGSRFVFGQSIEAEAGAWAFLWDMLDSLKSAAQVDPIIYGYELVLDWIAANDAQYSPDTARGAQHGVKAVVDGVECAFVIKSVLDDELKRRGLSPFKMAQGWKERGWLIKTDERHFTVSKRINGIKVRCYGLKLTHETVPASVSAFDGDDDFVPIPGDDGMPAEWSKQEEMPY